MENSNVLKYPKKSHRKPVNLPKESIELAEFFGIMIGDGGINNPWQTTISLNSIKDLNYSNYISKLVSKLFGIESIARKRKNSNTLILSLASTTIVNYLVGRGLPRGNKLKAGLKIPHWILQEKEYRKKCLRGLIDTDGCLFIHLHKSSTGKTYRNIGLSFVSYSPELISQVMDILTEYDMSPRVSKRGKDVYLYKARDVQKYLQTIGTSNDRIEKVYNKWRDRIVVECPRLESA